MNKLMAFSILAACAQTSAYAAGLLDRPRGARWPSFLLTVASVLFMLLAFLSLEVAL